ncbi:MAG: S-layer homology domain-containing protein [Cyanobacteria bacterium P01_A01_bin.105]
MIALFVAFLTLGSVFFWGFSRNGLSLVGGNGLWGMGESAVLDAAGETGSHLDRAGGLGGSATAGLGLGDGGLLGDGNATGDGNASATVAPNSSALLGSGDGGASDGGRSSAARSRPSASSTTGLGGAAGGGAVDLPRQAAQPATPGAAAGNTATPPVTPPSTAAPATAPTALEPTQDAINFGDVPDDYWAKPFVDALSSRGLMAGFENGTFKPDDPVTRAQLAQLIAGAFSLANEETGIDFNDLEAEYWAYGAIQDSVKGGFMNGFPDESFQPTVSVPRVQVLTALVTGLQTEAAGDVSSDVERYTDAAKIPDWAVGKVAAATQAGLVVNYPEQTQLAPNQPATRAEVAAMVYQALVYQGRIEPIESDYLVQP